uniref:DUF1741 domain-containing protein n=1 Tax=Steinernema glaseri TaxID=37863 RepID=A0A1I7Z887_9BILA
MQFPYQRSTHNIPTEVLSSTTALKPSSHSFSHLTVPYGALPNFFSICKGPGLRQLVEQVVKTTGLNEVADIGMMATSVFEKGEKRSHMATPQLGVSKINFLYQQIFEQRSIDGINWNEFFLLHFNGPFLRDVLYKIPVDVLPTLKPIFSELTNRCVAVIASSRNVKFYNACSTLTVTVFALANRLGISQDFLEMVFTDEYDVILRKLVSSLATTVKNENSIYLKIIAMDTIIILHSTCTELSRNCIIPYFFCEEFRQIFEAMFSDGDCRSTLGPDAMKVLALLKTKERSLKSLAELKPVLDDNLSIMGFLQIFSTWLRILSDKFLFCIGQISDEFDVIECFSKKAQHLAAVGIQHNVEESYEANFAEEVEFLLAFYNVISCNRKVTGSLFSTPPTECFDEEGPGTHEHSIVCSLLTFSSFVFSDLKAESSKECAKLTLLLLLRIADDGYIQNALHDVALSAAVPLYIKPQLHRPGQLDFGNASQTLATSLLALLAEFLRSHLSRNFLFDHYQIAVGTVHRIVVHEKRSRLRTGCWKQLFLALMSVLQYLGSNEQTLSSSGDVFRLATQVMVVVNLFITYGDVLLPDAASYDFLYYEIVRQHTVFTRLNHAACSTLQKQSLEECEGSALVAPLKNEWPSRLINQLMNALSIVNHITPKLTEISAKQGALSEEQVLKVVQESFDSLNLKLYDGLDEFEPFDFQEENEFLLEVGNSVVRNYWERRIPIDSLIVYSKLAERLSTMTL